MPNDVTEAALQGALGACVLNRAWFFSVAGCLVSIPLGIRKKSLAPLVFYGGSGCMLDIVVGVMLCERERQALTDYLAEKKGSVGKP